MKNYIYSDLALESDYALKEDISRLKEYSECSTNGNKICRLNISTSDLAKRYGKKKGVYVTVVCGKIWLLSDTELRVTANIIAKELKKMITDVTKKKIDRNFSALVAGLGNPEITPDAIGPLTLSHLTVTRHVSGVDDELFDLLGQCSVSAIAPRVLAQTGIETLELIRGAAETTKPDVIIAVDALAARSCDRLASTIQISNSGINPGSGIGNLRKAIDKENLGIPVVAIGVPTVIDSSTLVYDALEKAEIENISDNLRQVLDNGRGFFVSPKECDVISERVSILLAEALDTAFSLF